MNVFINGENVTVAGDPCRALLDVLRDDCLLKGAKAVCREGFCGACTVHLDGVPVPSCLIPVGSTEGRKIITIEGLAPHASPNRVQQAFIDHDVVQCGMCFPGIVMVLTEFLARNPVSERGAVKAALVGNTCRCTGYERIVDAVLSIATAGKMDAE